ncbi:MAG TPA: hypothetical protein VGY55_00745 [Pirellulales bacterium]|jgi:hypothetical protein|nr:hypothetical protein [Pirellulales bacterium]
MALAIGAWAGLCAAAPSRAEEPASPRELDVWGRFAAGSWKQTRIISETLDDAGKVTATTNTDVRTSIASVDSRHVTLKITVTVEAGGKRYDTEPQTLQHGYYGEGPSELVHLRDLGKTDLTIDGKTYSCKAREVAFDAGRQKTISKLFQADSQAPYVLRRETNFTDSANSAANHDETMEVIMLDMPYKVRSEIKPTAFERTVQKNAKGTTITVDVTSVEVPGGIVMRTLKELDGQGRITRRSTMELVDYAALEEDRPAEVRSRLFHRRRERERTRQ